MYTTLPVELRRVSVSLLVAIVTLGLLSSRSHGEDARRAEIRTLTLEQALDRVVITREILGHRLIHAVNKPPFLSDLKALRQRLEDLRRELGSSYADDVQRRRIEGSMMEIHSVLDRERIHAATPQDEQNGGRAAASDLSRAIGGTNEQVDTLHSRLDNLRDVVDDYTRSIRQLSRRANEGEISRRQLAERLHGKQGLDRKRQKVLHQIQDLEARSRQLTAKRAATNNGNSSSVLDEMELPSTLGIVTPNLGLTEWDEEKAADAFLRGHVTVEQVAEQVTEAMFNVFYPSAFPARLRKPTLVGDRF